MAPKRFPVLPLLAAGALSALALSSPTGAAEVGYQAAEVGYQYVSVWGELGSGDGQFNALREIDVAPGGRVFTVETGNQRVQRFTSDGTFQLRWGNPGPAGSSRPGEFNSPEDVAVGSDSRVYVADTDNHRVQWFTPEGVLGGTWGSEGTGAGQFDVPADLAAAPDGTVYVADFNTGRIQHFTRDGGFLGAWGAQGSGPGQFSWISGMSVGPDGSVYVVEQENHRVQRFQADGDLLGSWGTEGAGDGQFLSPSAIEVGPDGTVFVADKDRDDVQVFSAGGTYLERFGGPGTGPGQFGIPTGIAVSDAGVVYVADNLAERVQRFAQTDPTADRDGDALLDAWETFGYDANDDGTVDVNLPAMGADPDHKDIFVEIDWMTNHELDDDAIQQVVEAFAIAPVEGNPDGRTGIVLHVDNGSDSLMTGSRTWGALSDSDELDHVKVLGSGSGTYNWSSFDWIKSRNFGAARRPIFHYVMSVHNYDSTTSSGLSRGIEASDLIVSLGSFCAAGSDCSGTTAQQAGTFMHELGHNLGLRHGGSDNVNRKPNFLSVMNYAFQLSGLKRDGEAGLFDYSMFPSGSQTLADLNESAIDERLGMGGSGSLLSRYTTTWSCGSWQTGSVVGGLDVDCDGTPAENTVSVDLNNDGQRTTLSSWNDWDHVVFDGGLVGAGSAGDLPAATPFIEPRKKVLFQTARVLSKDQRKPRVTVTGPKHGRLKIRATDNRELDRIIISKDGRTRQVDATGQTKKVVRLKVKNPGRHRVVVGALDAAGNSAKVVRLTVRVAP